MCHTRMLVEQQDHKISLVAEQYSSVAEKFDWLIKRLRRRMNCAAA